MKWPKGAVAKWHRRMGLVLSLPLFAWLVSAFAMHQVVHDAPNGLQGVYDLASANSIPARLDAAVVTPTALLAAVARDGIDEVYALRLESHGPYLLYVLRPTPYALAMTFDAITGARLDPLPDSIVLAMASEHLAGTTAGRLIGDVSEYHRDYDRRSIPSVRIAMVGAQPSELILSRASGRPMRRFDGVATGFESWYRALHVFQWGGAMGLFTTVLYLTTAAVVVLAVLGLALWFWRRGKRRPAALTWHGRAGITVGVLLVVEILVGAYMWLSLGPLQDPFRGKNTFALPTSGLSVEDSLQDAGRVLSATTDMLGVAPTAIQTIEWRTIDSRSAVVVRTARNEMGTVFDAETGAQWEPSPEAVGRSVRALMKGNPAFTYQNNRDYYWNDLNRAIPVYHYRFDDGTDVFASRATGEIVSRRTGFWRAFSPFLMVHSAAFSDDDDTNALFLFTMLGAITILIVTGWWAWWRMR